MAEDELMNSLVSCNSLTLGEPQHSSRSWNVSRLCMVSPVLSTWRAEKFCFVHFKQPGVSFMGDQRLWSLSDANASEASSKRVMRPPHCHVCLFTSSFASRCFGLLTCRRRSWWTSLGWITRSLSCAWRRSGSSPSSLCQVRISSPRSFSELHPPVWRLLSVCSDRSGSSDRMAHDPQKDFCPGAQLSSAHHRPHRQPGGAAVSGVGRPSPSRRVGRRLSCSFTRMPSVPGFTEPRLESDLC